MDLDPVFLARIQFAATIGFHYMFPPLTIGLGLLLVLMEGMFLRTRNYQYEAMARFWTRIFGLIFAIGVASGVVMEFQFGTNWATYSRHVGDIFGAALAAEGIFAFFLESGFLAVLVFGWDRVSPAMHFCATCVVSLGSIFSAIWIVVANSWQQTPAGFKLVEQKLANGTVIVKAQLVDFVTAVLNHSTLQRLSHVLIGCMIAGAFLVLSVSCYYLLRRRHEDFARRCIQLALPFALVFCLLALVSGDLQGRNVGRHQPAKLAAMEGLYKTQAHAALHIFGIPDDEAQTVRYGLAIPGALSLLTHGDASRPIIGLDQFKPEDRPPVQLTFQSFHLMVALGMFMIVLALVGTVLLFRGRLFRQRWLLWVFVFTIAAPVIANQVGWIAAEVGRQPWIVYPDPAIPGSGLRTADAVSKSVGATQLVLSMILVGVTYALLFVVWVYVLDKKIKAGPEAPEDLAAAARRSGGWLQTGAHVMRGRMSLTDAHSEGSPPGAQSQSRKS